MNKLPRKLKELLAKRPHLTVVAEKRHFLVTNPVSGKCVQAPAASDWKQWECVEGQIRAIS